MNGKEAEQLGPIMEREIERQNVISAAVEAAEAVLQQYFSDHDSNPDEEAYLQYKAGANLMMKGVASIDRRVFVNDLTGFQLAELKPVKPEDDSLKEALHSPCACGRDVTVAETDDWFGVAVCSGCFKLPINCTCKKLASQSHAK